MTNDRWKVCGSPKTLRFILWGPWMFVANFITIIQYLRCCTQSVGLTNNAVARGTSPLWLITQTSYMMSALFHGLQYVILSTSTNQPRSVLPESRAGCIAVTWDSPVASTSWSSNPPADQYCPIWPRLFRDTIPAESGFLLPLLFRSAPWAQPGTALPTAKTYFERHSVTTHNTQHSMRLCVKLWV